MIRQVYQVTSNPPISTNNQVMDKIHIMAMDNLHHMVVSPTLLVNQLIKLLILVKVHIQVRQLKHNFLILHHNHNIQELSQAILNKIIK